MGSIQAPPARLSTARLSETYPCPVRALPVQLALCEDFLSAAAAAAAPPEAERAFSFVEGLSSQDWV